MALEDTKLFKAVQARYSIYALIVDFTLAFNTTGHDKLLLWIMYYV
jgi:hypothetical protein